MKSLEFRKQNSVSYQENINFSYYRWIVCSIICLCLISLYSRWIMTERLPFIMDELVDTQKGCQVGRGLKMYSDIEWKRTPLMTYFIGTITKSAKNSISTASLARKLMWFDSHHFFLNLSYCSSSAWLLHRSSCVIASLWIHHFFGSLHSATGGSCFNSFFFTRALGCGLS